MKISFQEIDIQNFSIFPKISTNKLLTNEANSNKNTNEKEYLIEKEFLTKTLDFLM